MANTGIEELKSRLEQEKLFNQKHWDEFTRMVEQNPDTEFHFDAERIEEVIKSERRGIELDGIELDGLEAKFNYDLEAKFNYDKVLTNWLQQNPFFAQISRYVRKRAATLMPPGIPLPSAAMCYNQQTDDVEMLYNNRWFAGMQEKEVEGVTTHEFYHLIWKHLTYRRREPFLAWNIATDLAINSIIIGNGGSLPEGGLIPGVKPKPPTGRDMTKEEKEVQEKFNDFIAKAPKMLASDVYFEMLMQWAEKNGMTVGNGPGEGICKKGKGKGEPGDGEGKGNGYTPEGVDNHDLWDQIPEEIKAMVEGKIKNIVEKAVKHADNQSNGWGNIPADIREQIRASVNDSIDWKKVLANFVGMVNRGQRTTSIKRINKRYPYIHPGTKRGYFPRIAVFVDQSGSVDNTQIEQIFGVLRALSKRITFEVFPFDTNVAEKSSFTWKRGAAPVLERVKSGGTSFDCVVNFLNKSENRGRWDGAILATDGECSAPGPSLVKMAYVVTPGHKLLFNTDNLVVQMTNEAEVSKTGVVR